MERVAVVLQGEQSLERRPNVVERDLLRVERTAGRLDVVLELLRALVAPVLVAHRLRPDAARHAAEHRVLRVHPVREKEREIRREVVDVHSARQVVLDEREAVRERERELRDRVRPRFGDVIPGYRNRVEVTHFAVDEILLNVPHQAEGELGREDARVLRLIFFEDIGLHRAAHRREGGRANLLVRLARKHFVARHAEQHETEAVVPLGEVALVRRARGAAFGVERGDFRFDLGRLPLRDDPPLALLIDRGVQEEAEEHRRRAVDRHRHRRRRIGEIEARIELLRVVDIRDRDAGVSDFAVDVGAPVGVFTVKRHRVERRREAFRR